MAGRVERREQRAEEEARTPIAIIPSRRVVDERQEAVLRRELARVIAERDDLMRYAGSMRIPPSGRTLADVEAECDRMERTLQRMSLTSIPVLGQRYRDELEFFTGQVAEARREARAGHLGAAATTLGRTREQLSAFGQIFEIELLMLMSGAPPNVRIEGVAPEDVLNAMFDSLEAMVRDVGTPNARRFHINSRMARRYAENAHLLNADSDSVRRERDAALGQVIRRGRECSHGAGYSAADERSDSAALSSFETNITSIRDSLRANNVAVFEAWRNDVAATAQAQRDESSRRYLEALGEEIDRLLTRTRGNQEVSSEEIRSVSRRYYMLTGREQPLREEERARMVEQGAADLRGSARTVRDGTPEWYGEQAQQLLREGRRDLAALAVSMGYLERSALSASPDGARNYISSYRRIHDVIAGRRPATPGMISAFATEIDIASMQAGADSLRRSFASGGNREERERVAAAAGAVRERISHGDVESARRLLDMAQTYAGLLRRNNFRAWTGSADMEAGIAEELAGRNGSERFNRGSTQLRFSGELNNVRTAIADWGAGLSEQRAVVDGAIQAVERYAREGNARDAQRVLTLLVMYADAVERLGVRRGNQVVSISREDARAASGMGDALSALGRGEARVAARDVDTVFMEGFGAAQRAYVEREAARLQRFSSGRSFGRDTITAALDMARTRAAAGDYRGSLILLEYVRDFYGAPMPGRDAVFREEGGRRVVVTPALEARSEGWRYDLFAGRGAERSPGYVNGRNELILAIQTEMNADSEQAHVSAAQTLDRATTRIATTEFLLRDGTVLLQKYNGTIPFVDGQPDTAGRIPLGERRPNGTYPDYLALSYVRSYEQNNPDDSQLGRGPSLEQLMARISRAANNGDTRAYAQAYDEFNARFQLVSGRAARTRSIDTARSQLNDLRRSISEIRGLYGDSIPAAVAARLDALERRRSELADRLGDIRGQAAAFPADEYSRFLVEFDRERRLATGFAVVKNQLDMTENYRRMVVGQAQGQLMSRARDYLATCRTHLESARDALLRGDMQTAETEYRAAMYERRQGMGMYSAENALSLFTSSGRGAYSRGLRAMWDFAFNPDKFWGSGTPGQGYPQFEGYQNTQTDAFHDVLFGSGTREESQRIDRQLNASRLLELSIFGIPADNVSQMFSSYVADQNSMRDSLAQANTAARAGNFAEADRIIAQLNSRWEAMNTRAQDNQWWGNAATITAGLAVNLIPGVGWVISGSIFTTMAFDRVATEYCLNGSASAGAWANLALTVGTFGLGGAAQITRSFAEAAVAAEATNAARLVTATRVLTGLTIGVGVGMSAYMGTEAYRAFAAGNTRDGILLTGMALFPWAHMAGSGAWRSFRTRPGATEADAAVRAQVALSELRPQVNRPAVEIEPTATPQERAIAPLRTSRGLLDFLIRYAAADEAGRARMMEALPESARAPIRALAENPAIQRATASGGDVVDIEALAALRRAAASFEGGPGPRTPGPRGTPPQWEGASWLLNPESFRAFLRDLMAADDAPAAARNARDIARARLEALRAQSPEAAALIDGLLRNPAVREAVTSGVDSPLSARMISQALEGTPARPARGNAPARPPVAGIRQLLPQDVVAAEQRATAVLDNELDLAASGEGRVIVPRPGDEGVMGANRMQPPRAMAQGGDQGQGPRPGQPARPPAQQEGGARGETRGTGGPRQGTPRAPAPTTEEEAAAQAARAGAGPVEVVRVGALRQLGRWVRTRYNDYQAARAARRAGPPTPEQFAENARSSVERTLRSVVPEEDVPTLMSEATRGVSDAGARSEIANSIRTAPQRVAEMMKSLFRRAQSSVRAESEQAMRTLVRLYSYDNVRAAMGELARNDPELAQAMRRAELGTLAGARSQRLSVSDFRARNAQQGLNNDDVMFLVEGIAREAARPMDEARSGNVRTPRNQRRLFGPDGRPIETRGTVALETIDIPRLQEQVAQAREAVSRLGEGRARVRAESRLAALEQQLAAKEAELGLLRSMIEAPQNQPLARAERLLGLTLTPAERAPMLLRLHDLRIIPDDAVLYETAQAGARSVEAIRGAVNAGRNPLTQALGSALEDAVSRGGNLDDALLSALRRPEAAQAVENMHGRAARMSYEGAVRDGTLDEVLGRIRADVPDEVRADVMRIMDGVRTPETASDFSLLSQMGERSGNIVTATMDRAGMFGREMQTPRQAAAEWWRNSMPNRMARGLWRAFRYVEWDMGRVGREMIRDAPPEAGMQRLGGWGRVGLQLLIWGAEGYLLTRKFQSVYEGFRYGGLEAGQRRCRSEFGVECSEANARWVSQGDGGDFLRYLPNRFPSRSDVRPGSVEELRRQWDRDDIIIDPARFNDILGDGRAMAGSLPEINRLLAQRRSGTPEEQQQATARLNEILRGFSIRLDSIDSLLSRENKQALDITDLTDLRIPDWLSRGIAMRYRDMMVDIFLTESGVQHARNDATAQFFLRTDEQGRSVNRDVFEFLWNAYQRGNIPAAYMGDAIRSLMAQGVLDGLRARATGRTTMDSLLRESLMGSHFYVEIPGATSGSVSGIMQNSFFGMLDRRTVADPAHGWSEQQASASRTIVQRLLTQYRDNPAAMAALNNFHILEGDNGEDLYGDPAQLAALIVQNPGNAVELARQRGFVGPAILAQIDPGMRNAPVDSVRFVRERSSESNGILPWIRQRRENITNLQQILADLSTTTTAAAMSPPDIQAYADRQADRYKQRGWWRGPTPGEVAAQQAAAQQRAPPPPGGRGNQPQTRDQQVRDTMRPQYGRRPGFEVVVPQRTDDQSGMQAPPTPVVVELSAQGEAFFSSDRASGLGQLIDGMVDRMFDSRDRRNQPAQDAQLMAQVYGSDRDLAKRRIKAEIYRLLTSANQRDAALRAGWGITVSGEGDSVRVEIDMRRARDGLLTHINEFVRSQRTTGGR